MKVNDVAALLKVDPLTIRVGLQQGYFPFGVAFKRKPENKNYCYVIFPEKVREYIGGTADAD